MQNPHLPAEYDGAVALPPELAMTDRQFLIAYFAVPTIVVSLVLGVWLGREFCEWNQDFARNQRIDREHVQRIKLGMCQEDIEEILGSPPGDYRACVEDFIVNDYWLFQESDERTESWQGDKGTITVTFDEEQTACSLDFSPSDTAVPSSVWQFLGWVMRDASAMFP